MAGDRTSEVGPEERLPAGRRRRPRQFQVSTKAHRQVVHDCVGPLERRMAKRACQRRWDANEPSGPRRTQYNRMDLLDRGFRLALLRCRFRRGPTCRLVGFGLLLGVGRVLLLGDDLCHLGAGGRVEVGAGGYVVAHPEGFGLLDGPAARFAGGLFVGRADVGDVKVGPDRILGSSALCSLARGSASSTKRSGRSPTKGFLTYAALFDLFAGRRVHALCAAPALDGTVAGRVDGRPGVVLLGAGAAGGGRDGGGLLVLLGGYIVRLRVLAGMVVELVRVQREMLMSRTIFEVSASLSNGGLSGFRTAGTLTWGLPFHTVRGRRTQRKRAVQKENKQMRVDALSDKRATMPENGDGNARVGFWTGAACR